MKKTTTKMLKAECPVCSYYFRVPLKHAKKGLPFCPIDETHGQFVCDLPEEDITTVIKTHTKTKASKRDELLEPQGYEGI